MIKVFLVEDEIMIRKGIRNSIHWEEEGYEFAGEASDGEIAYPMIIKEKPDILITDIKMPFMDGLELSKLLRKVLPNLKILILSGYDEFKYAKEAISLGVTDYLLKPVSSAKLLESLSKVAKEIRRECSDEKMKEQYLKEMQENVEREKAGLFNQLISGNLSTARALELGNKLDMNLSGQAYNIILFKPALNVDAYSSIEDAEEAFEKLKHVGEKIPDVSCFLRGAEGWAYLLTGIDRDAVREKQETLKKKLFEIMERYPKVEYFGGIGTEVTRIRQLPQSYHEASLVFSSRFTLGGQRILTREELNLIHNDGRLNAKSLDIMKHNKEIIERFLFQGTAEETRAFVDAYLGNIPEENMKSDLMRQYIMMDIYLVVSSFCEQLGTENIKKEEGAKELERALQSVFSEKEIRRYIQNLLKSALERRDQVRGKKNSDMIGAAVEFIEKNYMADKISLNTVSASVNMSPSYFSAVFSREVGKTFVEYLTQRRMKKAKELLICTSKKTSEVGFEVGYKDPHYFSYIFKKTEGCSPTEYRQRT